jgi:hypothetical protein
VERRSELRLRTYVLFPPQSNRRSANGENAARGNGPMREGLTSWHSQTSSVSLPPQYLKENTAVRNFTWPTQCDFHLFVLMMMRWLHPARRSAFWTRLRSLLESVKLHLAFIWGRGWLSVHPALLLNWPKSRRAAALTYMNRATRLSQITLIFASTDLA